MASLLKQWQMELMRRLRLLRRESEARFPVVPNGVFLNPSDADFMAYAIAPLALTFQRAAENDPIGWQTKVRAKLTELLGIQPVSSRIDGSPVIGTPATMSGGLRRQTAYLPTAPRRHVPITFVWNPATVSQPLPVMLCLQGHNSGAHISWGEARFPADRQRLSNGGDFAIQAVFHSHVAVCIEQIAFGERREQALHHHWDHPCVDACNRALLLGRTVLGDRVADVMAVIDWLRTRPGDLPGLDTDRIRAMGNSAGGETALYAAALDPRIEAVIASGCVGAWRKTSGTRRTCPDTVVPGVLAWIEYSDLLALCAPRPLLVVSGVGDHIYPFHLAAECAADARPAYAAFSAAHRLRVLPGPDGHRFYPDIAWPAFMELIKSNAP
jgi:hypothetical protein